MTSTFRLLSLLCLSLLGTPFCGCSKQPDPARTPALTEKIAFPELGPPVQIEPGVRMYEATIQRGGTPMKVWLYQPDKGAEKLPCVLIGPAGSHLIDGMKLAKGDQAEHLPYARAGFVVVAFAIDGAWPAAPNPSERDIIAAATAFQKAQGGLANARTALDFAIERVPALDSRRVYTAGHSSAATLALLVASADPRIKACAAFAPATDVEGRIGGETIRFLAASIPGFAEFVKASSPKTHLGELKCPVFLFHAKDDTTVPSSQTSRFASDLERTNSKVVYVEVPKGGHYQSMIREGIPRAIQWLQKLPN